MLYTQCTPGLIATSGVAVLDLLLTSCSLHHGKAKCTNWVDGKLKSPGFETILRDCEVVAQEGLQSVSIFRAGQPLFLLTAAEHSAGMHVYLDASRGLFCPLPNRFVTADG